MIAWFFLFLGLWLMGEAWNACPLCMMVVKSIWEMAGYGTLVLIALVYFKVI